MLDVETTFCYLGDMLCSGWGCDSISRIATGCCLAWVKLRKLLSSPPGISSCLRCVARCMCMACVHAAIIYNSETWKANSSDLQRLYHNDHSMIRWLHYSRKLVLRLLRQSFAVGGTRWCRRPRKTWSECVTLRESIPRLFNWGRPLWPPAVPGLQPGPPSQTPGGLGQRYWSVSAVTWPPKLELRRWGSSGPSSLMKMLTMVSDIDPQDRDAWGGSVHRCLVLPTSLNGTHTAS